MTNTEYVFVLKMGMHMMLRLPIIIEDEKGVNEK